MPTKEREGQSGEGPRWKEVWMNPSKQHRVWLMCYSMATASHNTARHVCVSNCIF